MATPTSRWTLSLRFVRAPASLSMEDAVAADRAARRTGFAWMLDRFIVPAVRVLVDDPVAKAIVIEERVQLVRHLLVEPDVE